AARAWCGHAAQAVRESLLRNRDFLWSYPCSFFVYATRSQAALEAIHFSGKRISLKCHRSRLPCDSSLSALTSALIRSAIKSISTFIGTLRAISTSRTMRETLRISCLQYDRLV